MQAYMSCLYLNDILMYIENNTLTYLSAILTVLTMLYLYLPQVSVICCLLDSLLIVLLHFHIALSCIFA